MFDLFDVGAHVDVIFWKFGSFDGGWLLKLFWGLDQSVEVLLIVGVGVIQKLAGDIAGVDLSGLSSSAAVGRIGGRILDLFRQFGWNMGWRYFFFFNLFGLFMIFDVVGGDLVIIFVVVHVGHEDFFGIFLVDEDIGFNKFDALIVDADLHAEIVAEEIEEILPFDVGIEGISFSCEYEDGSEEVDEDGIHDGVSAEALLDGGVALAEESEELGDEVFELQITEDLWIIVFVENKFEILVVDDLLYFAYVAFEVYALEFEAEF